MVEVVARRFVDRHAAGRELGERLSGLAVEDPVVFGLARGGVPVAYQVARALGAPLDVLVVRKIGAPGDPEYGIGAIAEGGIMVLDHRAIRRLRISGEELESVVALARAQVDARVARYRRDRPRVDVEGRIAIVVDDGSATGGSARAALRAVGQQQPRRRLLAVPVGAPEAVESLREEADDVICLLQPELMWAVGLWYQDFEPTSDAEIARLLDGDPADPPARATFTVREVSIPVAEIDGDLVLPERPRGLILFAHGGGSSRFSPRNRQIVRALNERGLATLLLDLLRREEERDRTNVFDVGLLAERLVTATRWVRTQAELVELPIGYFGASTGAGAALAAAAALGDQVRAVVSHGGRPDLAGPVLTDVRAAVLFIIGGRDEIVLELNRDARAHLRSRSELVVVPGATHLFEEPGALEHVSQLAGDWFERHLVPIGERAA